MIDVNGNGVPQHTCLDNTNYLQPGTIVLPSVSDISDCPTVLQVGVIKVIKIIVL